MTFRGPFKPKLSFGFAILQVENIRLICVYEAPSI